MTEMNDTTINYETTKYLKTQFEECQVPLNRVGMSGASESKHDYGIIKSSFNFYWYYFVIFLHRNQQILVSK